MIASMVTPSTQKNRPIGFALDDSTAPDGFYEIHSLVIRPEELSRVEPTRSTITQTLGGAFADTWGNGLPTVSISGHTGWRGNGQKDGMALFSDLRSLVMDRYQVRKEAAVSAGRDPGSVKLIFVDALDHFAYVVIPTAFVLRRSKSRPLLCQYQINLQVISDSLDDSVMARFVSSSVLDAGKASMSDSVAQIDSIKKSLGWMNDNFPAFTSALIAFVGKAQSVLAAVQAIKGQVDAVMKPLFAVADMMTQAARNIARAVSTLMSIPMQIRAQFQQLANAFHNIFCVLRNVFKLRDAMPDYSALYGASTCSSTAGGAPLSPLRNVNPFELLTPIASASYVTASGLVSLTAAATNDPVLRPMSMADATYHMGQIANG